MLNSRVLLGLLTAVLLSGCASMSKEECMAADWRTIGFEDGAEGKRVTQIGEHREACDDHGVPVDLEAYRAGRDEGLVEFCQPANGFEKGASGWRFTDICPQEMKGRFYAAFEDGNRVFKLRGELNFRQQQIERYRATVIALDNEISALETNLVSAEGDPDQRELWLRELDRYQRQRVRLEADIERATDAIEHRQGEIEYIVDRNRN